jgi:hypothetical protein
VILVRARDDGGPQQWRFVSINVIWYCAIMHILCIPLWDMVYLWSFCGDRGRELEGREFDQLRINSWIIIAHFKSICGPFLSINCRSIMVLFCIYYELIVVLFCIYYELIVVLFCIYHELIVVLFCNNHRLIVALF